MVHAGTPKTATTAIQRGLFTNRDLLRRHGVYVPESGRLELEPHALAHHHLVWQSISPGRFSRRQGGWEEVAREIADVDAETVLLSAEGFWNLVCVAPDWFEERLTMLSDDITVVVFVREQLSLLNSLYGQRIKMFKLTEPFRPWTEENLYRTDLDLQFRRWYDHDRIKLRAVPFTGSGTDDPLAAMLAAGGIEVPAGRLRPATELTNPSLGPLGVEAFQVATRYLYGRFPRFKPTSMAGRKLHRWAGPQAIQRGWGEDRFWAFDPAFAADVAGRLEESNQRFAEHVWGGHWPFSWPLDRPRTMVSLDDLDPAGTEQVSRFVMAVAERYRQLAQEESVEGDEEETR